MLSARIPNETRKQVYRRDGFCCCLCNDPRHLQVHHCIPRNNGGSNSVQNLVTLCANCHALAHGIKLFDTEITPAEVQHAIIEYLADYYAPNWEP